MGRCGLNALLCIAVEEHHLRCIFFLPQVFRLGVTPDSDYKTPNSDFMGANARQQWLADRAMVALYIASHRGHMKLCEKLIRSGN